NGYSRLLVSITLLFLIWLMMDAIRVQAQISLTEDDQAILKFIRLPPSERIQAWQERPYPYSPMSKALIAQGVDTVPYLASLVRSDRKQASFAIVILCAMDRFVPAEQTELPEASWIYIRPTNIRGVENPFMLVDGRRIDKEG